jgi:hypothetical protein
MCLQCEAIISSFVLGCYSPLRYAAFRLLHPRPLPLVCHASIFGSKGVAGGAIPAAYLPHTVHTYFHRGLSNLAIKGPKKGDFADKIAQNSPGFSECFVDDKMVNANLHRKRSTKSSLLLIS